MHSNAIPRRALSCYTRRSGDSMLIESYRDAYELNETASFLWGLVGGDTTIEMMAAELARRYDLDSEIAEHHVTAFVEELRARGFVVGVDE